MPSHMTQIRLSAGVVLLLAACSIGPDGRASGVTIEYFNIERQGTFARQGMVQP